jgi:hypothetical protein
MRPSRARPAAQKTEGVGNAGCRCTRSLVCKMILAHEHSHYRFSRNSPALPTQWFYGLFRALPGDEFVLPPSSANDGCAGPGRADIASADLTPATGARTTRLHRPRAASLVWAPFPRSQVLRPALRFAWRPTLPRPPHPVPYVRDDRDTPLMWDGTAEDVHRI